MVKIQRYELSGAGNGEVEFDGALLQRFVNPQMLKEYIVALNKNKRQWSANAQTRAEVNHAKKKPHPQKGTGRARQGFLGAPQFRGGGRVFAPKPKFGQHVKINSKERRAVVKSLVSEKIMSGQAYILCVPQMEKPSTRAVAQFMDALSMTGRRALFLTGPRAEGGEAVSQVNFLRSVRNIPRVEIAFFLDANGYSLSLAREIVILEDAVEGLKQFLEKRW